VKTIGQLPVPPTFVPRATDELPGVVSTSGHCHLGDSIDTGFAPCLQLEQSHDAETFGKLRAFSFRGTKEHVGRRRTYIATVSVVQARSCALWGFPESGKRVLCRRFLMIAWVFGVWIRQRPYTRTWRTVLILRPPFSLRN
jgi:hypothetical protein